MIEAQEMDGINGVEFVVDGRVTKNDFVVVADMIDGVIDKYGSVRLLEVVKRIKGFELAALWEDIKYVPRRLHRFSHVAVVADERWMRGIARVIGKVLPGTIRTFTLSEIDEARNWLATA